MPEILAWSIPLAAVIIAAATFLYISLKGKASNGHVANFERRFEDEKRHLWERIERLERENTDLKVLNARWEERERLTRSGENDDD